MDITINIYHEYDIGKICLKLTRLIKQKEIVTAISNATLQGFIAK